MAKFIEAFYYGNLEPQARSIKQNREIRKQMEILSTNEDKLTEALTYKNKDMFLDYANAWSIVNGESTLDSFITGFRLGANFTFEVFVDDDTSSGCLIKNFYRK